MGVYQMGVWDLGKKNNRNMENLAHRRRFPRQLAPIIKVVFEKPDLPEAPATSLAESMLRAKQIRLFSGRSSGDHSINDE